MPDQDILIRKITSAGIKELQQLSRETFLETFARDNTRENMQRYSDEAFSLKKLAEEINRPGSAFYFAVLGGKAIGYLKINRGQAQTEFPNENGLEIERIYVLQEFHGKKAGQILFDKALETAISCKSDYIWLGVWEKNPKAIRFYKKNGFVESGTHIFKLGDDRQTDIIMKRELKSTGIDAPPAKYCSPLRQGE